LRAKGSRLVAAARREFREATRYYRSKDPEVAVRFAEAIRTKIRFGVENPNAPPTEYGYHKLVLGNPWPYTLYYRLEDDLVVVAAVWAQARNPDVLRRRLEEGS
jgi:plasmid stabilization system protein ParE